jgi:hypothetical protein
MVLVVNKTIFKMKINAKTSNCRKKEIKPYWGIGGLLDSSMQGTAQGQ